jgi:hypothetical protein
VHSNVVKRKAHVTRALCHVFSIQRHLIGAMEGTRRPLNQAIRRAAASVWRYCDLEVIGVVSRSLARDVALTVVKKVMNRVHLAGGRVLGVVDFRREVRLYFHLRNGEEKSDFVYPYFFAHGVSKSLNFGGDD